MPRWQGAIPPEHGKPVIHRLTQAPALQAWFEAHPALLLSSAPTSLQPGALAGVAQVLAPFRHAPMLVEHGTLATHSLTQAPPLHN